MLVQLRVAEHAPRQGAPTPENPYYCPDVMVDAAARLRAAGAQFLRAVGDATDIDGATLLSLSPESIASVMQVSGVDPRVSEYIARSLLLASGYLGEAGEHELAALRAEQARALAVAYDLDLPGTPEELALLLDEADAELAQEADSTMDVLGYGTEPVIPSAVIEAPLDSDR